MSLCDVNGPYSEAGWIGMASALILLTLLMLIWNGRAWWCHHVRLVSLHEGKSEFVDNDMYRHSAHYKETFYAVRRGRRRRMEERYEKWSCFPVEKIADNLSC
jgi:hypothetical protein